MKITPWRIATVVWATLLTGVVIFKAKPPEPIYIEMPTPTPEIVYQTEIVEVRQEAYYTDIATSITKYERELLARATYLEAGNQSMTGQRAVVEVILNRVMDERFPDTIEEVLYQTGQFAVAPYLASAIPNEEQYNAVDLTLETSIPILEPHVLYFNTYLFNWQTGYEKIGDHYFAY